MTSTILLVEDHDANRAILKRRLERRGYHVEEASDGPQAINAFAACRPGIVLMDLSMPGMSGIEAVQRIEASCPNHKVPVVAVTAHATDAMRDKCETSGFQGFVTKPIDFEALLACIEARIISR